MFRVINASGKVWDGFGWSVQGKEFFSIASATRSLHEQGEDIEETLILPTELDDLEEE
jgi:hypothetical protein